MLTSVIIPLNNFMSVDKTKKLGKKHDIIKFL